MFQQAKTSPRVRAAPKSCPEWAYFSPSFIFLFLALGELPKRSKRPFGRLSHKWVDLMGGPLGYGRCGGHLEVFMGTMTAHDTYGTVVFLAWNSCSKACILTPVFPCRRSEGGSLCRSTMLSFLNIFKNKNIQ